MKIFDQWTSWTRTNILSLILKIQDWIFFGVYCGIVSILNLIALLKLNCFAALQIYGCSQLCCSSAVISLEDQVC